MKPQLNDGETLQEWVDFHNGILPERKGTPIKDPIHCYYCSLAVDKLTIQSWGLSEEELLNYVETSPEYVHCDKCTGATQRNICG